VPWGGVVAWRRLPPAHKLARILLCIGMTYDLYINGNLYESGFGSVAQALDICKSMGDWIDEVEVMRGNETVWCWPDSGI